MHIYGLLVDAVDLVCEGDKCGLVQTCSLIDGVLHAVVENLRKNGDHTAHWGLCLPPSTDEVWFTTGLTLCVTCKTAAGGAVLVLL